MLEFNASDPTLVLDTIFLEIERLKRAYDLLHRVHIYCLGSRRFEDEARRVGSEIGDFFGAAP